MFRPRTILATCALLIYTGGVADAQMRRGEPRVTPPDAPRVEVPEPYQAPATTPPVPIYVLAHYDFEGASGGADAQGWLSVDRTAQTEPYWHVDDFMVPSGGGSQAMWCGARPSVSPELCGYGCLPGYGNNWRQVLETPTGFSVQGDVTLSFVANWDTEPDYDYVYVQYLDKNADWIEAEQLNGTATDSTRSCIVPASEHDGTIKFRFRFESDGLWSDEDCNFDSDGAIQLDNLTVMDTTGVLHTEDFEGESIGALVTDDGAWAATALPGAGDYAGLFDAADLHLPTSANDTHVWGFTKNSPRTCEGSYNCFEVECGPDTLHVVPGRGWNDSEPDLVNEIWSPPIDLTQDRHGNAVDTAATQTLLRFKVYRNLTLDGAVLYNWNVRTITGGSCSQWQTTGPGFFGAYGDWFEFSVDITSFVDPGADQVQIALGAYDRSASICYGIPECGDCLTQSPLFDDVRVIRHAPTTTGVEETPVRVMRLEQNEPNPFNPTTMIRYQIEERARVWLAVYDISGRRVRTLVDAVQSPDEVAPVEWNGLNDNGRAVSSGMYFYRLVVGTHEITRKMVLLK